MRIAVLGIGNVLMGDDGFGPHVVKTFDAQYQVTPNIDVMEVGTPQSAAAAAGYPVGEDDPIGAQQRLPHRYTAAALR